MNFSLIRKIREKQFFLSNNMNFFSIIIFTLVLVIYIHINFHLKVSNDLEVYNIEKPSKDKLDEICDLKQPVVFDFNIKELNDN